MKRLITLLLLTVVSVTVKAQSSDYDFQAGVLFYKITAPRQEVAVVKDPNSCSIYSGDIRIPDSVLHDGVYYKVTSLGENIFGLASINSISIPKAVRSIGSLCFYGATINTKLALPDSLRTIGENAFLFLGGIERIFIPALVDSIGLCAFSSMSDLQTLEVDSTNEYYSSFDGALYNKTMTSLLCVPAGKTDVFTIPVGVTTVEDLAFEWGKCQKVVIPNTVTTLKDGAFWCCERLGEVHIPASVTTIEGGIFAKCKSLYNLTIDSLNENYVMIGGAIYSSNMDTLVSHHLAKDDITVECKVIAPNAFAGTNSLRSVVLEGVETIQYGAFQMSKLMTITLPQTLKTIDEVALAGCHRISSLVIPNSVTKLGNNVFEGCTFSSVVMSDSVKVIPYGAFMYCVNLNTYTGGASVERIEDYAFNNCERLTGEIVFPETLKYIGNRAFEMTGINSVVFTGIIDTIGDFNFALNMRTLVLVNPTPPFTYHRIANNIFKTIIPCGATEAYMADPNWSSYSYTEDCDGVEENPMAAVKVTAGYRSIEVLNAEGYSVAIYDVMGRCIVNEPANGFTHRHYSVPAVGVYVVRVNDRGYKVVVR